MGHSGTLTASARVKDTALSLPKQPVGLELAWPGPSPLTSLPRGPSPQISPLPVERLGWRSTTPSQLKVPAPSAGLARAQKARVPSASAARGPLPLSPPGGQEARSAPDSPRPRAVRRLAQGAGFLEEIRRKSAGPPASGSPPNPAGARSSAAPLAAPAEGWEGGAGPSVLPFLLGGGGSGAAPHKKAPSPVATDKHLSPTPQYGATCFTFLDVWERAEA